MPGAVEIKELVKAPKIKEIVNVAKHTNRDKLVSKAQTNKKDN
jgi:hypothetical protein